MGHRCLRLRDGRRLKPKRQLYYGCALVLLVLPIICSINTNARKQEVWKDIKKEYHDLTHADARTMFASHVQHGLIGPDYRDFGAKRILNKYKAL